MNRFTEDDRVRVDIPDRDDPDFEEFHRETRTVVDILEDDASDMSGDERDDVLYTVEFNDGSWVGFRWRNLWPAGQSK